MVEAQVDLVSVAPSSQGAIKAAITAEQAVVLPVQDSSISSFFFQSSVYCIKFFVLKSSIKIQ
jgi:hypothetical protein